MFLSGRAIFSGRTDDQNEAPTLRPKMSRPSSLEETLMLEKKKNWAEREGMKG